MKKVLFGFTAAALAAVMCVGLVGCGGGPDAKSVTGEQIEDEQWQASLDIFDEEDAKYTIELLVEADETVQGQSVHEEMNVTAVKNGPKASLKMEGVSKGGGTTVNKSDESVSELKDGKYTLYTKGSDDKWTSEASSKPAFSIQGIMLIAHINLSTWNFADYKYDEAQKGYVLVNAPQGTNPVLKFNKDGQLVAVYVEYEGTLAGISMQLEVNMVITYDAKDITIPTVG